MMLYQQLFLAATAAAFLVVPEAPESDREIISTLPFPIDATDADGVSLMSWNHLSVPCMKCQGEDTRIELDFAVEDETRLTVNGFELYPSADPWHNDLTASVMSGESTTEQKLGYGLFVKPELLDTEGHLSLVPIDLQIVEVGGAFVTGNVPKVTVKLIKAPSGAIIIGNVEMEEPADVEVPGPSASALYRLKEKVEEFFKKLSSGCGRHKQHGGEEEEERMHMYEGKQEGRPFRHDYPHAHHHHHGHHRHHWGRLLKNIAANIVLPVLAGITAGVGVAVYVFP